MCEQSEGAVPRSMKFIFILDQGNELSWSSHVRLSVPTIWRIITNKN